MIFELFRAVSTAELTDIRATGKLRAGPGSCEGKHLATTVEHARRWGELLHQNQPFVIVRVAVEESAVARFYKWDLLDGIGPAYFATIEQLEDAQVSEVAT